MLCKEKKTGNRTGTSCVSACGMQSPIPPTLQTRQGETFLCVRYASFLLHWCPSDVETTAATLCTHL